MKHKLIGLLTATAVALAVCAPAQAHTYINKRTPGKNATVSPSVSKVKAVFSGQLIKGKVTVKRASSGNVVATGGKTDARTVQATIGSRLARGSYKVTVKITAGDAHHQSFHWSFKVK